MVEIVTSKDVEASGELTAICQEISSRGLTASQWAELESCDQFQTNHWCGGYEATEQAFCFSLYLRSGEERWLSLTLQQIGSIAAGSAVALQLRQPG